MIENFTAAGFPLLAWDQKANDFKTVVGWTQHEGMIVPVIVSEKAAEPVRMLVGPTSYTRPLS